MALSGGNLRERAARAIVVLFLLLRGCIAWAGQAMTCNAGYDLNPFWEPVNGRDIPVGAVVTMAITFWADTIDGGHALHVHELIFEPSCEYNSTFTCTPVFNVLRYRGDEENVTTCTTVFATNRRAGDDAALPLFILTRPPLLVPAGHPETGDPNTNGLCTLWMNFDVIGRPKGRLLAQILHGNTCDNDVPAELSVTTLPFNTRCAP